MSWTSRWFAEAHAHHQAGRLTEARDLYCQVLERNPDHTEAHHQLGLLMHQVGQHAVALQLIHRAIQLDSSRLDLITNLGSVCHSLGDLNAAQTCFQQVLRSKPDDFHALCNLGAVLCQQDRCTEAVPHMEEARRLQPDHLVNLFNLGNVLQYLGRTEEAIDLFRQILARNPNHVEAQLKLESALWGMGQHREARTHCQNLLARQPSDALRLRLALLIPAILESAEEIVPFRAALLEEIARLQQTSLSLPDPVSTIAHTPFYLAYHGLNDRDIHEGLARLYQKTTPSLVWTAPHCQAPRPATRRVRVGFLSRFFRQHTIGKLTAGLVRELDRRQFEVILFSFAGHHQEEARQIERDADRTVFLPLPLQTARAAVAEQELDILFYPDVGMDLRTYFLGYARLARVQCVSWGHPVTTGIPNIDYFVSSTHLEPEGAQEHYSEQLVCLDRLPVYYERPLLHGPPLDRASLGLPEHGPIYLCQQTLFKLHPNFDAVLAQLLQADRHGHIVLIRDRDGHYTEALRRRWNRSIGPEAERIHFIPSLPPARFLHLVASADVMLDPLHFGGGNTVFEALGLGTPIVTLPGKYMRGRVTLGCYRQMGYEGCVARDVKEYVALAVRLGNDAAYRQDVSEQIRASSAALFADTQAVRLLERFFLHALQAGPRGCP